MRQLEELHGDVGLKAQWFIGDAGDGEREAA
jgi:hypothetical protein